MHIHLEDQFHEGKSILHHTDPRVKILLAIGAILLVNLTPLERWPTIAGFLLLIWISAWRAGLPMGWFLRRSAVAAPFLLAALPLPFTVHGTVVLDLPVLHWQASAEGLLRMTSVIFKSWISVQAAILLAGTTRFDRLLWGFRGLFLPRILVSVIGLMYRYLFVLADEALRLGRARASRSGIAADRRPPGILWQAQATGHLAGSLFIRSIERSERVYLAMTARGYRGEPQLLDSIHWQRGDTVVLILSASAYLVCLLAGFLR
jgi:cobalt/nickel transport system permease protein